MTGKELATARARLGWTQVELARRIGIASNSLARLERGERRISEPVARLVECIESEENRTKRKNA
jgi:transcriptional regulator with XRE-family HTH domain